MTRSRRSTTRPSTSVAGASAPRSTSSWFGGSPEWLPLGQAIEQPDLGHLDRRDTCEAALRERHHGYVVRKPLGVEVWMHDGGPAPDRRNGQREREVVGEDPRGAPAYLGVSALRSTVAQ